MLENIRIVLTDDEALFRKGMSLLLSREENLEILFEAENGKDLIEKLNQTKIRPDVIMMDLNMPELNGVETTKLIRKDFPEVKIIALTSYNSKAFITNMINIGASSYLVKNDSPDKVIHTINQVAEKGFYYDDYVLGIIHKNILSPNESSTKSILDSDLLSKREREILQLICEQKTAVEIGELLFISPRTVEGHRNNLLLKTESKNIAGLVVFALENKLVELESM